VVVEFLAGIFSKDGVSNEQDVLTTAIGWLLDVDGVDDNAVAMTDVADTAVEDVEDDDDDTDDWLPVVPELVRMG
jgi:hypothetical protein